MKAGESFGAAYVVGWFDSKGEMKRVYDKHKGATRIEINNEAVVLK